MLRTALLIARSQLANKIAPATGTLQPFLNGGLPWAAQPLQLHQRIASVASTSCRHFAAEAHGSGKGWGSAAPVSMRTLLLTMIAGAGVIAGTKAYKDQKLQQVMRQTQEVAGKASVGGPFDLIDTEGKRFTDRQLLGEFALLYFGFTHCPDICPDELEKVAASIDAVEAQVGVQVQPVFISIDPDRDTPQLVKKYVREFHPRMIGLTGDLESVKRASKAYRVYYNKTGDSATDYLVDHSIIHYLVDPTGEFVTFYSKSFTAEAITESVVDNIVEWKNKHPEYHKGRDIIKPVAAAGTATDKPPPAKIA